MRGFRTFGAILLVFSAGCGSRPKPDVTDPDPAAKIPGITKATRTHDTKAITQLVTDLSSDDPAIRLYSINALQRLTGQTFGYIYYATEDQRKPAVQRWQRWLTNRE